MEMETLTQAALLLKAVWEGVSSEYKSKYRQTIWEQFQSRAAAHARMTNDLAKFISSLCGTLEGAVLAPYDEEARAFVEKLLTAPRPEQQKVLAAIREQTAVCVLLLRNMKQEERAAQPAWEARAAQATWPLSAREGAE